MSEKELSKLLEAIHENHDDINAWENLAAYWKKTNHPLGDYLATELSLAAQPENTKLKQKQEHLFEENKEVLMTPELQQLIFGKKERGKPLEQKRNTVF